MKFCVQFPGGIKNYTEITARTWNEEKQQWSADFFGEIETSFPSSHNRTADGDIICSDDEFDDLLWFWDSEFAAMNAHRQGEIADYSIINDGDHVKYHLFHDGFSQSAWEGEINGMEGGEQ